MKLEGVKKVILGTAVAAAVAGVGVAAALEYQNGNAFDPTGADRALNVNQVVFPENDNKTTDRTDDQSDDSELWQKDESAQDNQSPKNNDNVDYLFENGAVLSQDAAEQITLNQEENASARGPAASAGGAGGTVYDFTNDAANADLILNGAGAAAAGGTANGGESTDNAGGRGNGSAAAGGSAADGGLTPTPTPAPGVDPVNPDTPIKREDIKDNDGTTVADRVDEWKFTPAKVAGAMTTLVTVWPSTYPEYPLYAGQRATKVAIFNALDAYISGLDANGNWYEYRWASNQVGVYFNIDAVSFDGGVTWIKDFPVTIPAGVEMIVRTSYRLTPDGAWIQNDDVTLTPAETRVYVLKTVLDNNITQMDDDITLNLGHLAPDVGSKMNLYEWQDSLLGKEQLTKLYTGWKENGVTVPFFYPVTAGRHFLEPGDYVDLDTYRYYVYIKSHWLDDDTHCYFQTLTNYEGEGDEVLDVPKYVQAVDIDDKAFVFVGNMHLPDTVLYVNVKNAVVVESFTVDEGNPAYMVQDKMLYTIDGSELVGIPFDTTEITVPTSVKKVDIPRSNSLEKIVLKAENGDELPEIDLDALALWNERDIDIYVENSEVLSAFIAQNSAALNKSDNLRIYCSDHPDAPVVVKNNCMMLGDKLLGVMSCNRAVMLPNEVTAVQAGSLQMTDGSRNEATALILPENGQPVALDKDWNEGTDIRLILCYNEQQAAAARAALPADSDIRVQVLKKSIEGAYYFIGDETVLVRMSAKMKEFDGILTAQDGTAVNVTTVGDMAFLGNTSLRWAVLPENLNYIGYQAFKGCTALEGLLIQSHGSVTIGYESFDECSSLRFAASQSLNPTFVNQYEIPIASAENSSYNKFRFGPQDRTGYNSWTWTCISVAQENQNLVGDYQLLDCGGTKVLYLADKDGRPWLALRSGAVLDTPELTLRAETDEVFSFAFESLRTENKVGFTTNIEDLSIYLGEGAFYNSDIGPDVVLAEYTGMGNAIFGRCEKLETFKFSYGCGLGIFDYGVNSMFDGCTNLREVTFDELDDSAVLPSNLFYDCNSLQTLNFLSWTPLTPILSYGSEFHFNSRWDYDESSLTVNVPAGSEDTYLENWRYGFLGYDASDPTKTPARKLLWNAVKEENKNQDTGELPDDDTVDELFREKLGSAENHVRALLRMDTVSEPTNTYYYRETSDESLNSIYTLVRVSPDVTHADLSAASVGISWADHVNYIAPGAFSECKKLESVYIPGELDGIYSGAFRGVGYDEQDSTSGITVTCYAENPPALLGVTDGEPFRFGVPDERIEFVFENLDEQSLLDAWTLPMAGYTSTEALEAAVTAELYPNGNANADVVQAAVEAALQAAQNRVRTVLFGSTPVESAAVMMAAITTPESALPAVTSSAPAEDPAADETETKEADPKSDTDTTPAPDRHEDETEAIPATPETAANG